MYENIICPACESRTFDVVSVEHRLVEIDDDTDGVKRLNVIDSDPHMIICNGCDAVVFDKTEEYGDE